MLGTLNPTNFMIESFFQEDGLEKYYTIALGQEWKGGNVFDDYC